MPYEVINAGGTTNADDVLTKIKTVDGSGSGLDADTVDGYHASATPTANTIIVSDSNKLISLDWFIWRRTNSNPTINDIPPRDDALWLNTDTGELFVYKGLYNGKAYWVGQRGTVVIYSPVTTFDIFGDNSAVALYRFENNTNDDGGLYNGTWSGTALYNAGKFGYGITFNGSNYIKVTSISSFPSSISVSLWVKQGPIDTSASHTLFNISANMLNTVAIFQKGSLGKMVVAIGNKDYLLPAGYVYEDEFWHHYVIMSSGDVYVDGNYVTTFGSVNTSSVGYITIGADIDDGPRYNDFAQSGTMIDQFRIFNRTLTEQEVKILYNESL